MSNSEINSVPSVVQTSIFVGAISLGLVLRAALSGLEENLIFWPGAYLLSLWVLALSFSSLSLHHDLRSFLAGMIGFSVLHLLLSCALLMVLERFFRLDEHYAAAAYLLCVQDHLSWLIDGAFWYLLMQGAKWLMRTRQLLQESQQRHQKTQEALNQSDLRILRQEINPHFLFNAMNGIAMKVRLGENKTAVAMIAALNELLRLSLKKTNEKKITLKEELQLLDNYLLIEKIRFDDQVEIVMSIPENLLTHKVPELILQPLVENAFKHGTKQAAHTRIDISASIIDSQIELLIYNSHQVAQHFNFATSQGTGLTNIAQRLRKLYGADFRFQSISTEKGIAFKITIPSQL